ncbi:MAG: hypothetical protein GF329_16035 [Candidatus Lokiarchaeota archaeon]|nr:hypothetical protein [Candidatus Lokiarchaeota archaeon]
MNRKIEIEKIELFENQEDNVQTIKLPPLTKEQEEIINPSVPPTSGIRMLIFEKKDDTFFMPATYQYMFFRVFKALSIIMKEEIDKKNPNLLLVSDDRPSSSHLLEFCAKIFTNDGYNLFFQEVYNEKSKIEAKNDSYYSRMSSPYGSASVALFDNIDISIIITASHNPLTWDGVKFYIKRPMPISGVIMKNISTKAIELEKINISNTIDPKKIDVDKKNNEYTRNLIEKIFDISVLKSKKIILWPYLGSAPELQDLFDRLGAEIILIEEDMYPPNPTINLDEQKIRALLIENNAEIAVLLDSDRDRVVFVIKKKDSNEIKILSPNEIYTAMHNILVKEYKAQLINVRTIPSDPRNDGEALMNFVTGVGYKHLGLILYSALSMNIDPSKFKSGIIYYLEEGKYRKLTSEKKIRKIFLDQCKENEDYIMALWEESGGHTFNILNKNNGNISSSLPMIADKYIAPAICIICGLIAAGHDLFSAIDRSITGTRTAIKAHDDKKLKIVKYFADKKGKEISIDGYKYIIDTFDTVAGKKSVIHLESDHSELFVRPSGTSPNVRIYIFGPEKTAKDELKKVKERIQNLF